MVRTQPAYLRLTQRERDLLRAYRRLSGEHRDLLRPQGLTAMELHVAALPRIEIPGPGGRLMPFGERVLDSIRRDDFWPFATPFAN